MEEFVQKVNIVMEVFQQQLTAANVSLANEESQKLDAINRLKTEKEARIILEKKLDSLKEELEKAQQNASTANEKVKTLEDKYKMLQEHNLKLENKEKDMILKYNVTLEKLCRIYEAQIADNTTVSKDDAFVKRETEEY